MVVDGFVYRVHRAPGLRTAMLDEAGQETWALCSATYVEPVTQGVGVIDPRDDRPALEHGQRGWREVEGEVTTDLRTVELPEAGLEHELKQRDVGPDPG